MLISVRGVQPMPAGTVRLDARRFAPVAADAQRSSRTDEGGPEQRLPGSLLMFALLFSASAASPSLAFYFFVRKEFGVSRWRIGVGLFTWLVGAILVVFVLDHPELF